MGREYYYFVASLPLLSLDQKPAVTYADFIEGCRRQLTQKDFELIEKAVFQYDGDPDENNEVLSQWHKFHHGLRNEIAWFRAEELNRDPYDYMRGDRHIEPLIVDVIAEASKSPNPLAGEKLLDRAKWLKLDELTVGHYFDIEFLIAYALKLQILERHQTIGSLKGEENFNKYTNLIHSKIKEQIESPI